MSARHTGWCQPLLCDIHRALVGRHRRLVGEVIECDDGRSRYAQVWVLQALEGSPYAAWRRVPDCSLSEAGELKLLALRMEAEEFAERYRDGAAG